MSRFTNMVVTARALVMVCERRGLDGDRILQAAGLSRETLKDPDARVPVEQMMAVWQAAYQVSADPNLALHAAEALEFGAYKVVDFLAGSAGTVGEALERIAGYFPLVNDWLILDLHKGARECSIRLGSHLGQLPRPPTEYTLAAILVRTRHAWQMDWEPLRIELTYGKPEDIREYERIFRCSIVFDAPVSQLVLTRSFWDSPLPTANPGLWRVLDEHAHTLLAAHPHPADIQATVRKIISTELAGSQPSLDNIAKNMGMTPRSLQRKLKDKQTSYGELLDDIRAQMAKAYLRDPDLALCEVSYLLGFVEQSSFTRAFKRWTGVTPNRYRKDLSGSG